MKIGTVKSSELQNNLTASYYLDRCANCGRPEDKHVNGKCGRWRRVFVEEGTTFEQARKEK